MPDPLLLLRLTANLHAAARDPERWPQAWAALAECFACPPHFVGPEVALLDARGWEGFLAARCAEAEQCARTASGACGQGPLADESKRQACLSAVDHLAHALATAGVLEEASAQSPAPSPTLAALDALPVPMLLCRADRRLVFANRAAQREFERQQWLRVSDGVVSIPDVRQDRRLSAALAGFALPAGPDECWLDAIPAAGEMADYALRRLNPGACKPPAPADDEQILLSVIIHAGLPAPELLERLGERRRLPPRQRELAGHLLAGLSLDAAAEKMGIGRRTARDHLSGLFRATGTSRQSELLARLSREAMS